MELLSPAGNVKHVEVAIKNKSDAVYGGLKNWNARHKALNFSVAEYNESVRQLHQNNIKFFLTLNTLVLDDEIDEIIKFLKDPETELPDAIIIADIGLIQKIRQELPNIPLHFSTQFGAHNKDDIKLIEYLGGERAILARELTLNEVNKLKDNTNIELECFVWGSQCMSFSGLCFFGSLINGGSGNRGKCIITCRDVYTAGANTGNLLYIPDLDSINLIPQLKGIDCIKLEGRRRNPKELAQVINQIRNGEKSTIENGYFYGKTVDKNKLFELVNSRIKPVYPINELDLIDKSDVFIEYKNSKPIKFVEPHNDENIYYVYSEIKNNFDINKKNLSYELTLEDNKVSEVLYVNHKGEGKTFTSIDNNFIEINFYELIEQINNLNDKINVYKLKYKRTKDNKYLISKKMLEEIIEYTKNDCTDIEYTPVHNFKGITKLYVETNDEKVVDEIINNDFVKVIYNISSFDNFKDIKEIVDKYSDRIIYKLPLFNWESENSVDYYKYLENKDVMFTRLAQLLISKDITFKNKYIDYTVYIWNKEALEFVKQFGINNFTASPELSYGQNINIFKGHSTQFIIGGKLPLMYSRQCFKHLYGCSKCLNNNIKPIKNEDKQMDFEIMCEKDHRFLIYKEPILNDYTKVSSYDFVSYRYVTYGQSIEQIKNSIEMFKNKDYYLSMKKDENWINAYENNVIESRC